MRSKRNNQHDWCLRFQDRLLAHYQDIEGKLDEVFLHLHGPPGFVACKVLWMEKRSYSSSGNAHLCIIISARDITAIKANLRDRHALELEVLEAFDRQVHEMRTTNQR